MSYLKCVSLFCQIPRDFSHRHQFGTWGHWSWNCGVQMSKRAGVSSEERGLPDSWHTFPQVACTSSWSLWQRLNSRVLLEGVGQGLSIYERTYAIFCVHSSLSSLGSSLFSSFSLPLLSHCPPFTHIGTYICICIYSTYERRIAGGQVLLISLNMMNSSSIYFPTSDIIVFFVTAKQTSRAYWMCKFSHGCQVKAAEDMFTCTKDIRERQEAAEKVVGGVNVCPSEIRYCVC